MEKSILHRGISINVSLDGTDIPQTDSVKYLGVTIDKDLNWKAHTEQVRRKSLAALSTIKRSSSFLPSNTRKLLFNSLVRPHLDYCSVVWHSCNSTISKRIERIQNYGMRVILGKPPRTSSSPLRDQLGWTTLQERRQRFMLTLVHRCLLNLVPPYLKNKFKLNSILYNIGTRGSGNIHLGQPNSEHYRSSFEYSGALHYNRLPLSSKSCPTLKLFKTSLKTLHITI
ncbi:uncharacterized protein LOC135350976 [Halichondria panicea]|uniref:uncharacterized protein LOC135350976 n=1 Tax=Halichondria panicea TaxID=6063 RepID=UPI00312BA7C0